jgi:hypothetical protein
VADATDKQKKLAADLFNRTVGHSLKVWRLIWSLQTYIQCGLPAAQEGLFNAAHQVASELIARPDYGTPEQRESVAQMLPNYAAAATSGAIEDAHAAAGAACIVFAHSMLDAAVEDYCKVSTMLSLMDWEKFVGQEKITLDQARNSEFDQLLRSAVSKQFNRLCKESVLTKIETLQSVCKPGSAEILKGYRFDGDRIGRIDRLRHDIVHKEALGLPIENVAEHLGYIEQTNKYLSALITHRYGPLGGAEAMDELL